MLSWWPFWKVQTRLYHRDVGKIVATVTLPERQVTVTVTGYGDYGIDYGFFVDAEKVLSRHFSAAFFQADDGVFYPTNSVQKVEPVRTSHVATIEDWDDF